jgi:hypothetical protein
MGWASVHLGVGLGVCVQSFTHIPAPGIDLNTSVSVNALHSTSDCTRWAFAVYTANI